jgi:hypothetical protein
MAQFDLKEYLAKNPLLEIEDKDATFITSDEYMDLDDPQFYGQTRVDNDGFYKMYWYVKSENKYYYTLNKL